MNDVTVRPANESDLAAVSALLEQAALPLQGVTDFFPSGYAVAEHGQQVVGAMGVETYGEHGLLRSAVVADNLRGAGLGAQLTRDRLAWSSGVGLRDIYLLTDTAAAFFERMGFARVDRKTVPEQLAAAPEFASICPSTAVVMRLALT